MKGKIKIWGTVVSVFWGYTSVFESSPQVRSVCRKITLWTSRKALRSNWWCWLTAGCRRLTAGSPSACWTWTTTRQCSNTAATEQLSGRGKRTTPTSCRYEYLKLSNTQQVYCVFSRDEMVLITIRAHVFCRCLRLMLTAGWTGRSSSPSCPATLTKRSF